MVRAVIVMVIAAALGSALVAHAKEKRLMTMAADSLSWKDLSRQRPGAKVAAVSGDHEKSAWKGFIQFPAGAKSGVHTHSSDLEIVVVSGTFDFGETADSEKPYEPGSYIRIPAGTPHSNSSAQGCVIFVTQPAKYDTKPVAGVEKKAKAQ